MLTTAPIRPAHRAATLLGLMPPRRLSCRSLGVAPCASIRAYKVCPTNNCSDADIKAGMDSVLIHGDVSK